MAVLAIFIVGVVYYLYTYNNDSMYAGVFRGQPEPFSPGDIKSAPAAVDESPPALPLESSIAATTVSGGGRRDTVQPADLLPPDLNSQWSQDNNLSSLSGMRMPNIMTPEFLSGTNTIGQSLKNPNLQLRADPVIQRVNTGPWNQPTIDNDAIRVSLDIGRAE